jgi:hypothetical protein
MISEHLLTPVKILVCVDKSPESGVAVKFACAKAAKAIRRGGIVELLHVMEPADFQGLGSVADKISSDRRKESEKLLNGFSQQAIDEYEVMPRHNIREGNIADEIVNSLKADPTINILMIASTQKGTGKLISWLSSQLGNKIHIPLMIVPGNLNDEQIRIYS